MRGTPWHRAAYMQRDNASNAMYSRYIKVPSVPVAGSLCDLTLTAMLNLKSSIEWSSLSIRHLFPTIVQDSLGISALRVLF